MAKGQKKNVTVETIEDDDETGTARNDDQNVNVKADSEGALEANLDRALELAGEDVKKGGFLSDRRIMRAVSLGRCDEKATEGISAEKAAKGLTHEQGTEVVDHAVVRVGRRKFLVVVTNKYRKFARAL